MEIHILSKEMIKPSPPSSPNDHHPETSNLSFIDQMAPPLYAPLIYFYPFQPTEETAKRREKLKKSLSEVLTLFYTFAGRFKKSDLSIQCKDQGVEYTEARVSNISIEALINVGDAEIDLLNGLLPEVGPAGVETTPLVAIQVSIFDCGGFAIATRILHTICDALTGAAFMNGWATMCRDGVSRVVRPSFELGSSIPARVLKNYTEPTFKMDTTKRFVTRSFLFDGAAVSALKEKATTRAGASDDDNNNPPLSKRPPSRMIVISAVIWRALMGVALAKHKRLTPSLLVHSVNLRGKTVPPMPDNAWGNFYIHTAARFEPDKTKMELADLVELIKDSITKVLADCSKVSLDSDEFLSLVLNAFKDIELSKKKEKDLRVHMFTSWCNIPFYDADFGWGKPSFITGVKRNIEMIKLNDTCAGDGSVEASISLEEEEMRLFEKDPDIVAFCS